MKKNLVILGMLPFLSLSLCFLSGCEEEEPNTPPVAAFKIMPESGNPSTSFVLDASSSSDAEDGPTSLLVRWDYENDGQFDSEFSSNKIINRQFPEPGTYHITLEVKDSGELMNSITKTLVVEAVAPEVTTDTISNISAYSALCGGEVVNDFGDEVISRGICWSTTPGPTISDHFTNNGTGIGKFESYLTDLNKNTLYYVRAYATSSAGTGYGNEIYFTTLNPWSCEDPITCHHVEGDVAPISKTVVYGTVKNIPGEPSKCWITQNLGADQQAVDVYDPSEASAGWYWQFNRKRGFKHDGINRVPNTYWITEINESSDWTPQNDPCRLELGEGWRLPAQSEWFNIDEAGGWNNANGPWNSALKLHASGYLQSTDGAIIKRGVVGHFWSNLQGGDDTGWNIGFNENISYVAGNLKSQGYAIRCISD